MTELFANLWADNSTAMMSLMVFLASGTLAFTVMALVNARGAVKKRAAGIRERIPDIDESGPRSLGSSSVGAAKRLVDYATKHYSSVDNANMKVLRRRFVQAGIYDSRAIGVFFLTRTMLAIGLGLGAMFIVPMFIQLSPSTYWMIVGAGGCIGYVGPSFLLDRRIKKRRLEHQSGFPDFMDLLVVCADSGLSMEAALDRVGRELGQSYPSLCSNIHMTNLEIRAGRTITEALEHLGERLGLEESRSFATLIGQSIELGSSITDALRIYSEDMRHKRLSRAEEKAYALPAKLSLPMMICIFPVIFVVILLPVFVRLHEGQY
jgi:tight adherence protein C